jgi:beta-lactamase regulating signal transducer with metallopeptidase domain
MTLVMTFHVLHHGIEAAFSVLILFAAYYAIKRFRLAIWKKGWYMVGASALIFTLVELYELWEVVAQAEESVGMMLLVHTTHIIAFPLLAIGIFSLADSAGRIWGGKEAVKK